MKKGELFFELLQVAIGTRKSLSVVPTEAEWNLLFELSKKQALTAIAFRGISHLREEKASGDDFGGNVGIDEMTYLKWLGLTAKVAQRNKELNEECAKVCAEMAHDGLQCCVLKGQSNLVNYPEDLRECRSPGDIDLWTLPRPEGIPIAVASGDSAEYVNYKGIAGVVEYAQQWRRIRGHKPITKDRVLYYHVEANTDAGTEVELHYRPSFLCSPLRNWRLQRWFRENEPWGVCDAKIDGHTFPILPISTNAVYQLLHIYKHLFEEGIGLRQLLDYYFVLRALHIEQGMLADRTESMAQWAEGMGIAVKSNKEIMHTLSMFGMKKFASATMYVLQTVFAMPDEYLICPPNVKEGKFLLNEIMQAGNFGKYDDRIKHGSTQTQHAWEKTKHNLRLLTHYPEEVICEPFFRVYHWVWRRFELWRY